MTQPDIERESEGNGIWLCPTCHTQIDKSPAIYDSALLHQWKFDAISRYRAELAGQPESDGNYLHENELIKARQFLASQQEIYWQLAEFVRNRPYLFGHTKFIFPEKIKSKVGFVGGVFKRWHWNNDNPMWAFSISIRRWENELLRICHLMSSDPRMQSYESSTVVDVSTASGSSIYTDPLMQAIWSYVDTYEQFVNFINGF